MKKANKYLISLILMIIFLTGCNNNKTNNNINNNETDDNNVVLEKNGHTLNTSVGKFIIDKDGSVYYINQQESGVQGTDAELTEKDLSILGIKKQYTNYTYQPEPLCDIDTEGCTIEAYKLDLTNISSVYEVSLGNSVAGPTIIFLSYDGKVHELSFNLFVDENQVVLTKNVGNYSNIVSVVPNMSFEGYGAILIDRNGNKYDYTNTAQ